MWTTRQTTAGAWEVHQADQIDSPWHSEAAALARADRLNRELADTGPSPVEPPASQGRAFYSVLCVEGVSTEEAFARYLEVGGWNMDARILPLPFMFMDENTPYGHEGAVAVGTLETMQRMADGRRIFASGHLTTTDEAADAEAQIESRAVRFVSIDMGGCDVDEEIRAIDEEGWPTEILVRFDDYTIMGATACPFPALPLAVVWLDGMDAPEELTAPLPAPMPKATMIPVESDQSESAPAQVIISAAGKASALQAAYAVAAAGTAACELTDECGGPALPPLEWFPEPNARLFSAPTRLTVTKEGRMLGHIGKWGEKFRGNLNVTIPHSPSGYAQFMTGTTPVRCCDDQACGHELQSVRTGVVTLGGRHASTKKAMSPAAVQKHYEDTCLGVADVVAGEDEFGPWISGALRPGVDDARVRELLGSAPSGDWRPIGGQLDLVAVHCVNMPGFPVFAAEAHVEHGQVLALVAAGAPILDEQTGGPHFHTGSTEFVSVPVAEWAAYCSRLEAMERRLELLGPELEERLAEKIR